MSNKLASGPESVTILIPRPPSWINISAINGSNPMPTSSSTVIPLPKTRFDLYNDQNVYDHLTSVEVDGKPIPYSTDGLIYYKAKKLGKCGLGGEQNPRVEASYMEIVYVVPLEKPLKPGHSVEIKYVGNYPKAFSEMYKFEYTSTKIREITMKAYLEVVPPEGYVVKQVKRQESTRYKKGIYIVDATNEIRKTDLEDEVQLPKVNNGKLQWEIDRPVIGYLYGVPFIIVKKYL